MNPTDFYSKKEIQRRCGISYQTVYNWLAKDNWPLWALKKLGFKLTRDNKKGK